MTYEEKLRQTIRNIIRNTEMIEATPAEKEDFMTAQILASGVCKEGEIKKELDLRDIKVPTFQAEEELEEYER